MILLGPFHAPNLRRIECNWNNTNDEASYLQPREAELSHVRILFELYTTRPKFNVLNDPKTGITRYAHALGWRDIYLLTLTGLAERV